MMLGLATIAAAQALCWTIFNVSPTQNTCLFTDGNKASVRVWHAMVSTARFGM